MKTAEKKKRHIGLYVAGSIALAAGMAYVMPKVLDYLSGAIYEPTMPETKDDDWGPEIVKRTPENNDTEGDHNGEL